MDNQYLIDESGKLRFTATGMRDLAPYFAKAGIDIRHIKSLDAYYDARAKASPYFMDWLADRAAGWPRTEQYDLLRTALFGEPGALQRAVTRFDLEQSLEVVHP